MALSENVKVLLKCRIIVAFFVLCFTFVSNNKTKHNEQTN